MSFLEYSRKQKTAAKKKQKERKEQKEESPKAEQMDKSLETRSLRKRSSSVCYLENTTIEEENPDESNKEIEEMEDVKNKTPKKKPRMEVEGSKSGKKSSGIPSSGK